MRIAPERGKTLQSNEMLDYPLFMRCTFIPTTQTSSSKDSRFEKPRTSSSTRTKNSSGGKEAAG